MCLNHKLTCNHTLSVGEWLYLAPQNIAEKKRKRIFEETLCTQLLYQLNSSLLLPVSCNVHCTLSIFSMKGDLTGILRFRIIGYQEMLSFLISRQLMSFALRLIEKIELKTLTDFFCMTQVIYCLSSRKTCW